MKLTDKYAICHLHFYAAEKEVSRCELRLYHTPLQRQRRRHQR
jgi:hypothetical protein